MKKFWIFALAALALVSCVREWIPETPSTEDGLIEKMGLNRNQNHFIRLERVRVNQPRLDGETVVDGVIESREYYGLYIKYYIRCEGQTIKVIERNDGTVIYEAGEQVHVGIHPRNLMCYDKQEASNE